MGTIRPPDPLTITEAVRERRCMECGAEMPERWTLRKTERGTVGDNLPVCARCARRRMKKGEE